MPSQTSLASRERIISALGQEYFNEVCVKYPTDKHFPSFAAAVADNAPTLVSIDKEYGQQASITWLKVHILRMQLSTGLREKLTDSQREALARQLRNMGYYVKLSEMMQFFERFEQGKYEIFRGYERPNIQVVTSSFSSFLDDLQEARERHYQKIESERREQERKKWDAEAVPCPEHIKKHLQELNEKFQNGKN